MKRRHIVTPITTLGLAVVLTVTVALTVAACGDEKTAIAAREVTTTQAVATTQAVVTTEAATADTTASLPAPGVNGTIAFAEVTEINGKGWGDLWVINTDGTARQQLTATSDASEETPAWSPDGGKLAYCSGSPQSLVPTGYTLESVNADGSGGGPLTGRVMSGLCPRWSPDGSRVAFAFVKAAANVDIAVMNADGSGVQNVTSAVASEAFPTWLPDGALLFLMTPGGGDIYRVNADGSGLTAVTEGGGHVGLYALSPDGNQLVLHDTHLNRLVMLPAGGEGTPVVLVDQVSRYVPIPPVSLTWSPDGKAIAFAASSLWGDPGGSPIYVVNADGTGLSMVPNTRQATDVAWRPK